MRECEDLIKSMQQEVTRDWNLQVVTYQNVAHMWSMQEVEGSRQLDHYRTKSTVWHFFYLVTGTRDSFQSRVTRQCTLFY